MQKSHHKKVNPRDRAGNIEEEEEEEEDYFPFLKLVARGFLQILRFPPLLHRFNDSANKIKLK